MGVGRRGDGSWGLGDWGWEFGDGRWGLGVGSLELGEEIEEGKPPSTQRCLSGSPKASCIEGKARWVFGDWGWEQLTLVFEAVPEWLAESELKIEN